MKLLSSVVIFNHGITFLVLENIFYVILLKEMHLEETVHHLFKFVHRGSTSGFIVQAHLLSSHRLRSPIALHWILNTTLDHNRPVLPDSTVHLQ